MAALRAGRRHVLVVANDPSVARWCAEPIEIGASGFALRPAVLRGKRPLEAPR
jgi:hypothetical protein